MDENANFGWHFPRGHGEGEWDPDSSNSSETIQPPSTSSSSSSTNSSATPVIEMSSESSSCQYLRHPKREHEVYANLRSSVRTNEPAVIRSRRKTIADKFRLQMQHHYDFLIWGKQPPDVKGLIQLQDLPCCPEIVRLEKLLRIFTLLLLFDGSAMLLAVIVFGTGYGFTAYFRHFVQHNEFALWLLVVGVIQPILTAAYCAYARHYPASLRPYYLRSGFLIAIPCLLVIITGVCMCNSRDFLRSQLLHVMELFEEDSSARELWGLLQAEMSCCGLDGYTDWRKFSFEEESKVMFPGSCCKYLEKCTRIRADEVWEIGCFSLLYNSVVIIGSTLLTIALLQILFQAVTIHLSRRMHQTLAHELMDERSAFEVLFGPCCSLCTSNRNQFELTEDSLLQTFPFLRNAGGDLCQSSREQLIDNGKSTDFNHTF